MSGDDNSWFSERTKTWMVSITMTLILGGMAWGYYEAVNYRAERELFLEQSEQMERLVESEPKE